MADPVNAEEASIDEMLRTKLTAEEFERLRRAIAWRNATEYQRGFDANGWGPMLRGMGKSVTAWLGWLLVAYPLIEPQLAPLLADVFGAEAQSRFVQLMGVLVILARMKTKESLEAKGAGHAS